MAKRTKRTAAVCAVGCFLWGAPAVFLLIYGASRTLSSSSSWDAIIVAGCHVNEDGKASKALTRRTVRAVELYRQGVAPVLVFTGGVGTYPPSEAEAAARVARALGVPDNVIVLEDRSTSTEENARFSAQVSTSAQRVVVVSDTYHILRSERVFGRYFPHVRGVGSSPTWDIALRGALREVLALGWYAFKGRL